MRDVLRGLARRPLFTLTAVGSLALGIGANTAVYSALVSALRPLGVDDTEGLVAIVRARLSGPDQTFRYAEYRAYASVSSAAFSGMAAHWRSGRGYRLERGDAKDVLQGAMFVNGDYFATLGVRAFAGRLLVADDERVTDRAPAAVLTEAAWRRLFRSDPAVIGATITIDRVPVTVVGVTPPGFYGMFRGHLGEIFLPLTAVPVVHTTGDLSAFVSEASHAAVFRLVGRLRPGVSPAQAEAAVAGVARTFADQDRQPIEDHRVRIVPANRVAIESKFHDRLRNLSVALGGIAAAALLIACANVAGLLLARAQDRRRELAVRVALGASLPQIGRLLAAEAGVLAVGGGLTGLGVAFVVFEALRNFGLPGIDVRGLEMRLDIRMLLLTTALSLATGLVFGLAPAWPMLRTNVADGLGRREPSAARTRARSLLLVVQVALCLPMLVGTGLFVRSMRHAGDNYPGFDPDHVLLASVSGARHDQAREILEALDHRARAMPGVAAADVMGWRQSEELAVDGSPQKGYVDIIHVRPEYFDVFGLPPLRGRLLSAADVAGNGSVAVVNERLARKIAADGNALGHQIHIRAYRPDEKDDGPYEVVGIVKDTRSRGPGEHGLGSTGFEPRLHLPREPRVGPAGGWTLAVQTRDPKATTAFLQRESRGLLPRDATLGVVPFRERLVGKLREYRLRVQLVAAFGAISLILCAVGLYGLLAYMVSRRTAEIGVRIAIGAPASAILSLVLRQGLALVLAGLALGTVLSLWAGRVLALELMGVSPDDVATLAGASLTLLWVAAFACLVPARRAARLDPVRALRCE